MNRDHLPRQNEDHFPPASARDYVFPQTDLGRAVRTWIADGQAQGWSKSTLDSRTATLRQFLWWLEHEESEPAVFKTVTPSRLRTYLSYCREPHPGGRYGCNHRMAGKQARPSTIQTYHRHLRTFLNFCLTEGLLEQSPLRNIKPPRVPNDQIQPFTPEQIQSLLNAARASEQKERNVAVLLLLVDAGLRVSELCSLRVRDIDRTTAQISIVGKGNKRRTVYAGTTARRALSRYLQNAHPDAAPDRLLFHTESTQGSSDGLTPNGVRLMMRRLGKAANVKGVRVSPHTARHTFAVSFLRGGGNLFELQALMGHSDLTILRRYVALADADLAQAHRAASPVDRLRIG